MNCNLCFEDFISRPSYLSQGCDGSQDWSGVTVSRVLHDHVEIWSRDSANTPGTWGQPIRAQYSGHVTSTGQSEGRVRGSLTNQRPASVVNWSPICLWSARPPGHEWNFDKISKLILTCRLSTEITSSTLETIWLKDAMPQDLQSEGTQLSITSAHCCIPPLCHCLGCSHVHRPSVPSPQSPGPCHKLSQHWLMSRLLMHPGKLNQHNS